MRPTALIAAAVLLGAALPAAAQTGSEPAAASANAYAADVASSDAIIAALYQVISGDKGVERDWARFRNLFHPTARMVPTGKNAEGQGVARAYTPEEYITRSGPVLIGDGFHEQEIFSRSERFGNIMHVWSTYDARHSLSEPEPFLRGINSIQLFNDGARWWVMSVYWQAETPDTPLPADYLPPEG